MSKEMNVDVTVGEQHYAAIMVYTLRHRSGYDQATFGKRFGLSQTQVSRIENYKTVPSEDLLQQICDRYNISLDQIYGRVPINKLTITA